MKKIFILIGLITAAAAAYADEEVTNYSSFQPSTVFDTSTVLGFYGSPILQGSYIGGNYYYGGGVEGGLIINHWLVIGIEGKGFAKPIVSPSGNDIVYGWGGLMLGFIVMPEELVHPYIKAVIGGGSIAEFSGNWYNQGNYSGSSETNLLQSANFFSMEGELGIEINVIKWMRIDIYGGYHYIYGPLAFDGLTDKDFISYDVGVKFEFGRF